MTSMSYTPEPAIWSRDTGQQTPRIDSCQLTITLLPSIKEVRVNLFLKWATYVHMDGWTRPRTMPLTAMTMKTQFMVFLYLWIFYGYGAPL